MDIKVPQTAESSHLSLPIKQNLDLHTTIMKKMKDLNFTYHWSIYTFDSILKIYNH